MALGHQLLSSDISSDLKLRICLAVSLISAACCGQSYPPGRTEVSLRNICPFLFLEAFWAFVKSPTFVVGCLLEMP